MNCHSNWSKINGCMCSLTSRVCHSALDTDPGDVKARFRRAQAFQKLGRLDQAFLDAQRCAQLEPKNKAFQDLLRQLGAHIQQKVMSSFFIKWMKVNDVCYVFRNSSLIIIFSLHSVVLAAKLHRCSCAANVLPPLRWICKWLRSTKGKGGSRSWRDHSRQLFFHSQRVSRSVCKITSSFIQFQAAQNLVVLSREDAGAEQIFRNDGVKLIQRLLQSKQEDVVLSALRTLVGLCTGHQSRVSYSFFK